MSELSLSEKRKLAGAKGGKAKKGKKSLKTIERTEALRQYRERVSLLVDKLLNAQIELALGSSYLYRMNTNGKATRVTDEDEIKAYFDGDFDGDNETYHHTTVRDPKIEAVRDMLDRTFGRPTENLKVTDNSTFSLKNLFLEAEKIKAERLKSEQAS